MRILLKDGQFFTNKLVLVVLPLLILFAAVSAPFIVKASISKPAVRIILPENSSRMIAQHDQLLQQVALANEFGFVPSLVSKVQQRAESYVNGDQRWRLIRTPENLSYIMLSLIKAESDGVADAKGDGGRATGLTQMWMATARRYDSKVTEKDLKDPDKHLDIAFAHFNFLLTKFHGNIALTLYAWNRGEGKVDLLISLGQKIENGYGPKVYSAVSKEE